MNGANPWYTALLSQQLDPNDPDSPNWKVVGAGDFNNDAVPDLVWRHQLPGGPLAPPNDGLNAIWYMGGSLGLQFQSGALLSNAEANRDWKICGAGDFNADGKTDILWRHTTLGANVVWFMNNSQLIGSTFLQSLTDPAWKIASQDTTQSTWRQQRFEYSAPRHDDSNTSAANDNNRNNREAIKSFIVSQHTSNNAKGVFIIGHATIPYSGFVADDGHQAPPDNDHQGAWPADMYYADVNGSWTDNSVNYTQSTFPENINVIGDGKFDNGWSPSDLELFVGRIDFSRLSSFGTANAATSTEGLLIQQYIDKAHRYRTKQSPFPVREFSVTFGTVLGDNPELSDNIHMYGQAIVNSSALFGRTIRPDMLWRGLAYRSRQISGTAKCRPL